MDSEWTHVVLPRLLEVYDLARSPTGLPEKREKYQWKEENKIGFFRGIFEQGFPEHKQQVLDRLQSPDFLTLDRQSQNDELQLILNTLYNFYIYIFHQYQKFADEGPVENLNSSRPPPASNSSNSTAQNQFKKKLEERDSCCLFCWQTRKVEGAHILSSRPARMPNINDLLQRVGIQDLFQVQNGLYLCQLCHSRFEMYVEVKDNRMVVKSVNPTDDDNNQGWWTDMKTLRRFRQLFYELSPIAGRVPPDANEDLLLFFVSQDPTDLPSMEALKWHKASCHIWRMAGGAESKDDFEDECVPPVPIKDILDRVRAWNSEVTMSSEILD